MPQGVAPGYFATELTKALVADEQFSQWVRGRTPAGRWGDTQDLVGALLFLASGASDFVNGQTLFVDGGTEAAGGWYHRADGTGYQLGPDETGETV